MFILQPFGLIQTIFPLLPCLGKKSFLTVEAAPMLQFLMGVWRQRSPGNIASVSWGTSCFTFLIQLLLFSQRRFLKTSCQSVWDFVFFFVMIRCFALPALSTLPNPWEFFFFFKRSVIKVPVTISLQGTGSWKSHKCNTKALYLSTAMQNHSL